MKIVLLIVTITFLHGCGVKGESGKNPEPEVAKPVVAEPSAGELIVNKNCKVCHAQGINGAPIIGNKKMWGPRLEKGKEVLISHAINGFNDLMPPKGGNPDLSDEDIGLAVDYMLKQLD